MRTTSRNRTYQQVIKSFLYCPNEPCFNSRSLQVAKHLSILNIWV